MGARTPRRKARAPRLPPDPCRPPGSESLVRHVVSARPRAREAARCRESTRWRGKSPEVLGREQEYRNREPVLPNEALRRRRNRSVAGVEEHRCARKLRAILRARPPRRLQYERGSSTAPTAACRKWLRLRVGNPLACSRKPAFPRLELCLVLTRSEILSGEAYQRAVCQLAHARVRIPQCLDQPGRVL